MRRSLLLLALLAPMLSGCVTRAISWADLQITSPVADVRVDAAGKACVTPCSLRFLAGRTVRVLARDPTLRTDFIYEVRLGEGLNELEVLGAPQ